VVASHMRNGRICILMIWVLMVSAFPAFSQPKPKDDRSGSENKFLQEAVVLYDNTQYQEAMQKLLQAIKVKGVSRKDIVEIYKYMGFIYIAQGNNDNAKKSFENLLKVDPSFEMNPLLTSPKLLDFFNKVRDEIRKKDQVLMRHTPLSELSASERIEVKAYVVDLQKRLSKMQLYFRRRGDPEFSTVQMNATKESAGDMGQGAETYVGTIPFIWNVYGESELFVDYYIAVLDGRGNWAANAGNPKQPITFRVNLLVGKLPAGALSPPAYKTWWFWTLMGVTAAGLAAGGYFLFDSLSQGRAAPDTGSAVLILRM
jgi:tetratricopeptide (TPR) repeat protein